MEPLNYRVRFMNVLSGRPVDRLPFLSPSGRVAPRETFRPGVEEIAVDDDERVVSGFDCCRISVAQRGYERVPVNFHLACPLFEAKELPGDEPHRRRVSPLTGHIEVYHERDPRTFVTHGGPVKTEQDWEEYSQHYQLSDEGRYPKWWDLWASFSQTAEHPIGIRAGSLFNILRGVLGDDLETGTLVSFHDRPEFVRKIIKHMADLVIATTSKALCEAKVDFVTIPEALGNEKGALISPDTFQEFFGEHYKRIFDHFRSHGLEHILFRGEGLQKEHIPLVVRWGATGLDCVIWELDLEEIRSKYPNLAIIGGIDRRVLFGKTIKDFEREADRAIELTSQGRMIPCLASKHLVGGRQHVNGGAKVQRLAGAE